MSRRALVALWFLAPACTAGGLDPTPVGDDDITVADPDAGVPEVACELPAFTAGVSTLSGCGVSGAADGPRGTGTFANPVNVAPGSDGEVYVADFDNDRVRVIDADGAVRTVIAQANFAKPFGLAVAADGTLYVQTDDDDEGAHSIETGTVWRLDGDVAVVVARHLGRPRGLLALPDGRLLLSDYQHHDLRLLDPSDGTVTLLAGNHGEAGYVDADGAAARFDQPYGAALLPDGSIAVADRGNDRVRAVTLDGAVTTLVDAGLTGPQAVTADAAGVLYVGDTDAHVVKRVDGDAVTTVVGSGAEGWLDSEDPLAAELYGLEGLAVAAGGDTLWIADGTRGEDVPFNRVRVVALP